MSSPEEIRRDIERTRAELSENVDALGDSTSPSNIAREQVDKVKEGAASLKQRVFGSPEDPYDDGMGGDVRSAVDDARGAVADARNAVTDAPQKLESHTKGNPLAAGLIALGFGALIGGLIPSTRKEQEVADQLKDAVQPLADEVRQMAVEAKDKLQPLAQEAVESVRDVAQDAGQQVKQDAVQAKDEVAESAQSSADKVKDDAQGSVDQVKHETRATM